VLTPSVRPSPTAGHAQSAFEHLTSGDQNASLLTTVGVGCVLLAVNVLVLLCVCYHRKVSSTVTSMGQRDLIARPHRRRTRIIRSYSPVGNESVPKIIINDTINFIF